MIISNLSVLLSERKLTAKKVSQDTGISRPTLTALTQNRGNGIQYDTLNKLCNYLGVTPNQLLNYVPYEFNITCKGVAKAVNNRGAMLFAIEYKEQNRPAKQCNILIYVSTKFDNSCQPISDEQNSDDIYTDSSSNIESVWDYKIHPNNYDDISLEFDNCIRFYNIYNKLPQLFKQSLKDKIYDNIYRYVETMTQYKIGVNSIDGNIVPFDEPSK